MGIMFITQDLGVIAELADKVVVMYKGKIVEQGNTAEVLSNLGLSQKMTHISTGGGASLELLEGKILTGDSSAILLCKYILEKNPESTVITCLNSGNTIEKIVSETNSVVIRTKVGSVEVSRRMVKENAIIGFEENGGFMYGIHNHVRDGAMTMALVLDLLANSENTLTEKLRSIPTSFTTKDKISCSNDDAKIVISHLLDNFPDSDTSDGIKITLDNQNWVMIRPSGTEPIIRIYAESDNQKNLDHLMHEYTEKIKSILAR